jgi:hypothetical protein
VQRAFEPASALARNDPGVLAKDDPAIKAGETPSNAATMVDAAVLGWVKRPRIAVPLSSVITGA